MNPQIFSLPTTIYLPGLLTLTLHRISVRNWGRFLVQIDLLGRRNEASPPHWHLAWPCDLLRPGNVSLLSRSRETQHVAYQGLFSSVTKAVMPQIQAALSARCWDEDTMGECYSQAGTTACARDLRCFQPLGFCSCLWLQCHPPYTD